MLLKNCVPAFITEDIEDFDIIYKIQQEEIDKLNHDIKEALAQFFVYRATWGIRDWEMFLALVTDNTKDLGDRQANIIAKLRGQGTSTVKAIENVAQSFVNDDKVKVIEDNPNSIFIIDFHSDKVKKISDIENAIDEIKPAHLDYKIAITEEKTLLLETKIKEYPYPWFMCGTFQCGTKPDIENFGIKISTELNVNTHRKDALQRTLMCGDESPLNKTIKIADVLIDNDGNPIIDNDGNKIIVFKEDKYAW